MVFLSSILNSIVSTLFCLGNSSTSSIIFAYLVSSISVKEGSSTLIISSKLRLSCFEAYLCPHPITKYPCSLSFTTMLNICAPEVATNTTSPMCNTLPYLSLNGVLSPKVPKSSFPLKTNLAKLSPPILNNLNCLSNSSHITLTY